MSHWAEKYIGIPYSPTGEGPEVLNCWNFVRLIQREVFGLELPHVEHPGELRTVAKLLRDHPERRYWHEVERPVDGDCVMLRAARYPMHIGIWLNIDGGGVLHCVEPSSLFQSVRSLSFNGWKIVGFYRFNPDLKPELKESGNEATD